MISFMIKRGNQEKPEITTLEVLTRDTKQLQGYVRDYLIDFHNAKWSCEATIDKLSKNRNSSYSEGFPPKKSV
ncbi:MAG: hypothetical protein PHU99_07980 [Candidatus Cloacimonetes bacterium]|nr:hypothetical protein [Candidatus Cloacimonadota bacterium]MDD3097641.1 hypothetical protein [Candidatus Cloacimonadota bacterium]MDY0337763.1 hypothetical protein [Candidatus Cloacimonadaceae bacterium]